MGFITQLIIFYYSEKIASQKIVVLSFPDNRLLYCQWVPVITHPDMCHHRLNYVIITGVPCVVCMGCTTCRLAEPVSLANASVSQRDRFSESTLQQGYYPLQYSDIRRTFMSRLSIIHQHSPRGSTLNVRIWHQKSIPALKELENYNGHIPITYRYSNEISDHFKLKITLCSVDLYESISAL